MTLVGLVPPFPSLFLHHTSFPSFHLTIFFRTWRVLLVPEPHGPFAGHADDWLQSCLPPFRGTKAGGVAGVSAGNGLNISLGAFAGVHNGELTPELRLPPRVFRTWQK